MSDETISTSLLSQVTQSLPVKLTPKQELFTNYIFQGITQRKAWELAGYSTNYPVEDIDTNACILANSTKVKQRLNELKATLNKQSWATVEQRKNRLTQFINEDIINEKGVPLRASNLQATDILNKMDKLYSEQAQTYNDIKVLIVYEGGKDVNRGSQEAISEGLHEGEEV